MATAEGQQPARKSRIPVVFISSTVEDLKLYRAAARDAANRPSFRPEMQGHFGPAGRPPLHECLQRVSHAALLVVIVAHRYGWAPPGQDRSVTWLEYEQALRAGGRLPAAGRRIIVGSHEAGVDLPRRGRLLGG